MTNEPKYYWDTSMRYGHATAIIAPYPYKDHLAVEVYYTLETKHETSFGKFFYTINADSKWSLEQFIAHIFRTEIPRILSQKVYNQLTDKKELNPMDVWHSFQFTEIDDTLLAYYKRKFTNLEILNEIIGETMNENLKRTAAFYRDLNFEEVKEITLDCRS